MGVILTCRLVVSGLAALTGPNHSGVELHGFLSYLIRCNVEGREYKVFGYKGKQVRDPTFMLKDVCKVHV